MNQYPWSILIEIYQYHDQYQDRKQPNIKYTIYETSKHIYIRPIPYQHETPFAPRVFATAAFCLRCRCSWHRLSFEESLLREPAAGLWKKPRRAIGGARRAITVPSADWLAKRYRTMRNSTRKCSFKSGFRRQSEKRTVLKHCSKGSWEEKSPNGDKFADKSPSHYHAICRGWVAKHHRTAPNSARKCSSKSRSRSQSEKGRIWSTFWNGML